MDVFSNRVVNDWNGISLSVVSTDSTNAFKKRLDKLWVNDMVNLRYRVKVRGFRIQDLGNITS